MYSVTKEFKFEYAHRLTMDYESACKNIHGHSAKVVVTIHAAQLNYNHMVIDFGHLKFIQEMLDSLFDHAIVLNGNDSEFVEFMTKQGVKTFILQNGIDPTSEVLARIIWDKISLQLNKKDLPWDRLSVVFYETATNYATYFATNLTTPHEIG